MALTPGTRQVLASLNHPNIAEISQRRMVKWVPFRR